MSDDKKYVDEATGTETMGHEWDGIQELDTPLPRWWLWTFYVTIVWGIIYTILYPSWPMVTDAYRGITGYSSRAEVARSIAENDAANAGVVAQIALASFEEISASPDLDSFARAGGEAIFKAFCSQCHGAGAAGATGYPNLIDDAWLWGGNHEAIAYTVRNGIRWDENDDTRFSQMPAFGADGLLERDEIEAVADYILAWSGGGAATEVGETVYLENCAACHGDEGLGNHDLGAPNLADAIWLYGGDRSTVIQTIQYSRYGVMPAWNTRLTEAEIKKVAHYVYTLGGGAY